MASLLKKLQKATFSFTFYCQFNQVSEADWIRVLWNKTVHQIFVVFMLYKEFVFY